MSPEQLAKDSESSHQTAFFAQCALKRSQYPELEWIHHIPNGGMRDKITAGRLKAQGVRSGVYDVFLPAPRGSWHGFYLEFKKPAERPTDRKKTDGRSENQKKFGAFIHTQGYAHMVVYSWDEAWNAVEQYLNWK